jgi:putative ABC transport system permease protein
LPTRLEVVTGAQITKEGQSAVRSALGFFDTFLMVFAGIALFVGSFLIFNTFSIVVAQRLRELALLRALGAGRGQVVRSVLAESAVVGALASAAGLGAGIGLALALRALLDAFGVDIPSTGLVISARTVLVCLVLGTVITVVAAVMPARKAGKVAPVAALRDIEVNEETRKLRRTISGGLVTAAGLALLLTGLFAQVSNRVTLVGAGGAVTFIGVAVLGPLLSRPLSRVLGAPLRWFGVTGVLARNNAMRSPKRTASTAAALMVGVALVALMSVLAASLKASVGAVIDKAMRADFVVSSGSAQPGAPVGFSPRMNRDISALPQVASSTGVRADTVRIAGHTGLVMAADPRHVDDLFDMGVIAGSVARMTPTGVGISQHVADTRHLALGAPVDVIFSRAGTKTFTVQAIYTERNLAGDYVLPLAAAQHYFNLRLDFQVYVTLAPGVTPAAGRQAIDAVLAHYPTAHLLDRTQYKAQQLAQIDQLLNLVYGLLALALFIALIGIANTLGLSIHERVHELGLLRAVGMTRRQLRATIRAEAVIVALLGAAQGLLVGTLLGWAIVRALHSHGVQQLSVPFGQLLVVALLAGLAGVLAAAAPSRRAARLDVLRAIATS